MGTFPRARDVHMGLSDAHLTHTHTHSMVLSFKHSEEILEYATLEGAFLSCRFIWSGVVFFLMVFHLNYISPNGIMSVE